MKEKHTAENIKAEVERLLSDFNIHKQQIYSVTTDNARNMIKAVSLLSESDDEDEIEFHEYANSMDISLNSFCAISIKSAAHILQLAVKDFFAEVDEGIVNKVRKIVKSYETHHLGKIIWVFGKSLLFHLKFLKF